MVMLAGPLAQAIAAARAAQRADGRGGAARDPPDAGGNAADARAGASSWRRAADAGYVLLAGRYEGIDERLVEREVDEEIAIGDFVVSGGELPALMLIDAIARLLPGALNDEQSAREDSFVDGLLDCPHYTRPEVYEGEAVPDVLLSGHHAADSPLAPRAGAAAHAAAAARPARGPDADEGRGRVAGDRCAARSTDHSERRTSGRPALRGTALIRDKRKETP